MRTCFEDKIIIDEKNNNIILDRFCKSKQFNKIVYPDKYNYVFDLRLVEYLFWKNDFIKKDNNIDEDNRIKEDFKVFGYTIFMDKEKIEDIILVIPVYPEYERYFIKKE